MEPVISIIVPVYNAEKTLERCLNSVLAQSFQDFEIILIDDGSSDSSANLCDQYAAADSRIRVIHQSNSGVSAARNVGIRQAEGKYLLFLDCDDALEDEALCRYTEAAGDGIQDVIIGSLAIIEGNICTGRIGPDQQICAHNEIWEQICMDPGIFGYAGGKMIRTEIIRHNRIAFKTHMQSQEDMDFFLSAYEFSTRFRMIPETVYQYYYAPSTRIPPIWDFIANQIKMLRIGKTRTTLSAEAQSCVYKRILSLLYTGLYHAAESGSITETAEKIARVDGLIPLLQTFSAAGEHGFVARNFAAGRYGLIQRYFWIRNRIRDVFRVVRGRRL